MSKAFKINITDSDHTDLKQTKAFTMKQGLGLGVLTPGLTLSFKWFTFLPLYTAILTYVAYLCWQ